jgi:cell division protein FtsA
VFGIRRAEAERLKCRDGSALSNPRDHQDVLNVNEGGEGAGPKVTRAQLNSVICQRVDPIIADVGKALTELGFSAPGKHHVVLTGGGAELKGLADHMQAALGRSVRIGRPTGLVGLPDAHSGPAFSTLCGLLLYAHSNPVDLKLGLGLDDPSASGAKPGVVARIMAIIRENY